MMISVLDNLPIRPVGEWAYDKIYRLVHYFGIFAGGMKDRWAALNYVEIGSGPGRCVLRENCLEIDGTALAIIRNPNFSSLQKAIFIDASSRVAEILNARIGALGAGSIASAVVGDYSNAAGLRGILKGLPEGSLNFIFIDPTECDVPFQTIEQIVRHLNTDLLVNVALGTDANRNLVSAILLPSHVKVREKYEAFLGKPGFCAQPEVIELAKLADHTALRRKFAETYKNVWQTSDLFTQIFSRSDTIITCSLPLGVKRVLSSGGNPVESHRITSGSYFNNIKWLITHTSNGRSRRGIR